MRRLFFFFFFPTGALILFLDARVKSADVVGDHVPGKTDGRDRDDGDDGQSRERLGRMFGRLDCDFQVFKAQAGKMLT